MQFFCETRFLILLAFITGNSSLEPLLEGLLAEIHIELMGFRPYLNRGPADNPNVVKSRALLH